MPVFILFFMLICAPPLCFAGYGPMPYAPIGTPIIITSPYGPREIDYGSGNFHFGMDMVADSGDQLVYAVADGYVVEAGPADGYGNWVVMEHVGTDGQLFYTTYGDLQEIYASLGASVKAGTPIAYYGMVEGQTGTGDHIHFQVSLDDYNGRDGVDPVIWSYYAPWLSGDYSRTQGGSFGAHGQSSIPLFNIELFLDFTGKLQEIIDTFANAAINGIKLITSIVYYIIGILMAIDFSLTFILDGFDLEKTRSESYSIFKLLILKGILYCFFFFLIINWGSVLGESSKSFFVTTAAMAAGADPKTAEAAVSSPMFVITKGMHVISPLFDALHNMGSETSVFSLTDVLFGVLFRGLFIFVSIIILLICFALFTYQICIAYLEFFFIMLFSLSNFIWAGLKQTRRYAASGVGGIFTVSAKLFFFTFIALVMQHVLQNIIIEDLTIKTPGPSSSIQEQFNGKFGSVEEFAQAIVNVESKGRYDLYNSETGAYGAYQQRSQLWDIRCREYESTYPLDKLCRKTDGDSPANAPDTYYSWCKENQDKVSLFMMRKYHKESNGDYYAMSSAWSLGPSALDNGVRDEEFWQKVRNANGASIPRGKYKQINLSACLKLILFALLFVMIADKIGRLITKTWSGKGFVFTESNE